MWHGGVIITEPRFEEVIERLAREGRSLADIVAELKKERRWATVHAHTVSHYAREHGIKIQGMDVPVALGARDGEQQPESEFVHQDVIAFVLRPKVASVWPPQPPTPEPPREWVEAGWRHGGRNSRGSLKRIDERQAGTAVVRVRLTPVGVRDTEGVHRMVQRADTRHIVVGDLRDPEGGVPAQVAPGGSPRTPPAPGGGDDCMMQRTPPTPLLFKWGN